jgi:hypothetical protein
MRSSIFLVRVEYWSVGVMVTGVSVQVSEKHRKMAGSEFGLS